MAGVKMLVCRYVAMCPRGYVMLGYDPLDCGCGATGGQYNRDGDTVTVWGDGVLVGLHNKALLLAPHTPVETVHDFDALWPYPETNGKVTRLTARPGRALTPDAASPPS